MSRPAGSPSQLAGYPAGVTCHSSFIRSSGTVHLCHSHRPIRYGRKGTVRHHFTRERIKSGELSVIHCASEDNCADMMTKALAKPTHSRQLALVNMCAR